VVACYARAGEHWSFYEIDPAVVEIARDPRYFTLLENSEAASIEYVVGDARLELQGAPEGHYDALFVDVFSGDSPPLHLMTAEALELYRSRVALGGLIAMHVSNRFMSLAPVIARGAGHIGLGFRVRVHGVTAEEFDDGKAPSIWVVMSDDPKALAPFSPEIGWVAPKDTGSVGLWTDDHQNVFDALRSPF